MCAENASTTVAHSLVMYCHSRESNRCVCDSFAHVKSRGACMSWHCQLQLKLLWTYFPSPVWVAGKLVANCTSTKECMHFALQETLLFAPPPSPANKTKQTDLQGIEDLLVKTSAELAKYKASSNCSKDMEHNIATMLHNMRLLWRSLCTYSCAL